MEATLKQVLERIRSSRSSGKPTTGASSKWDEDDGWCEKCRTFHDEDDCDDCHGKGRFVYFVDRQDPRFGKAFLCQSCQGTGKMPTQAELEAAIAREWQRMGIPTLFRSKGIKDWVPHNSPVVSTVLQFCYNPFPPAPTILTFCGTKGTGKTHLACGALKIMFEHHEMRGHFADVPALMKRYRAAVAGRGEETTEHIDEQLRRVPVLVLDDLGVTKRTEFVDETIYALINHRYAEQKPLIVTTNVALDSLEERVSSRLKSGLVLQFTGRDRRAIA